jgi:hypothetical protein
MFDEMTGAVGFAMHKDWLAEAAQHRRVSEAGAAQGDKRGQVRGSVRVVVAKGLVALATRIAGAVPPPTTTRRTTVQRF